MFKLGTLLAFMCLLFGATAQDHQEHIQFIENNLLPAIIIEGRDLENNSISERMAHFNVPGVSIAFFDQGEIQWTRTYGVRDVVDEKPVDENTVFQAASISKPVAAAAMLTMVEAGALDLDTDVNTYLKGWQITDNKFTEEEDITLRRLVSHNAGLTVHGFGGYSSVDKVPTTIQVLDGAKPANSAKIEPDTFPGAIWHYSGGGYTVMQKCMADVAGQDFPTIMEEMVLSKAGMERSTYQQPIPEDWGNIAYAHRGNGSPITGHFHTYPEMAAAGLWTTPSDLGRFAIAVQNAYHGKDETLMQQATAQQMLTDQFESWGLGPSLTVMGDTLAFSHGGSNEGFRCQLFAFAKPITQGVAIMTNGDNGGNIMGEVMRAISETYGWNTMNSRVKTVIDLSKDEVNQYAGTYLFEEGFRIDMKVVDGVMEVTQVWNEQVYNILPESKTEFFDENGGMPFVFAFGEDGSVISVLVAGQYSGKKSE